MMKVTIIFEDLTEKLIYAKEEGDLDYETDTYQIDEDGGKATHIFPLRGVREIIEEDTTI